MRKGWCPSATSSGRSPTVWIPTAPRAEDVMTLDLACVAPGESVLGVANLMLENEIRHVPVTQDDVVVGIVSERDALARGGRGPSVGGRTR